VHRSTGLVEILSRVQFCTVFVHISTSQRVNKNCTKLDKNNNNNNFSDVIFKFCNEHPGKIS
jgi:hypothetical protein